MFYELREYLEQTDADIPQKLEKHPAAHAKPAGGNARGELALEHARMRGTQLRRAGSSRGVRLLSSIVRKSQRGVSRARSALARIADNAVPVVVGC